MNPNPRNPPAMTDAEASAEAHRLITDFATNYRDDSPIPTVGPTPPVAQPGRPPMSAKAVDDTARMLGASALIATTGGATTAILWASGNADPLVVALIFGAPTALALAISRLFRNANRAVGDTHNHYNGPVQQTNQTINSRSTWLGKTTNNL